MQRIVPFQYYCHHRENVECEQWLEEAEGRDRGPQGRAIGSTCGWRVRRRERDEAVYSASADQQALEELERKYEKERAARRRMRRLAVRLGLAVLARCLWVAHVVAGGVGDGIGVPDMV